MILFFFGLLLRCVYILFLFLLSRVSSTAGFVFFLFFGFIRLLFFSFFLTRIFTVNTCIVLFCRQLRLRARSGRRLKFLLVPRLSPAVSRGLSFGDSFLFFFFIYFFLSTMFLWGTRGYVKQRRVITLTRPEGSLELSPRDFCPNRTRIPGLRKAEKHAAIDAHRADSSSQNLK